MYVPLPHTDGIRVLQAVPLEHSSELYCWIGTLFRTTNLLFTFKFIETLAAKRLLSHLQYNNFEEEPIVCLYGLSKTLKHP